MNVSKSIRKIFHYLLVMVILLDGNAMYFHLSTKIPKWYYLLVGMLIICVIGYALFSGRIKRTRVESTFLLMTILEWYLLFFFIIQSNRRIECLRIMIVVACMIFYMTTFECEKKIPDILIAYRNVIILIAIISLVFWIGGSLFGILSPSGKVYTTWTADGIDRQINNYYYLYFEPQVFTSFPIPGGAICRNCAIFTEAPMASLHFSLCFLITMLLDEKKKNLYLILLGVTIFSTFSTTGICIMIIIAMLQLLFHKTRNIFFRCIKFVLLPLILIVGVVMMIYLISSKMKTGSGALRIDDFIVCFKTWLQSPIIGHGLGNSDAIYENMTGWRTNLQGLSNSLGEILANGGVYIFILYLIPTVRVFYYTAHTKDKNMFIMAVCFTFMLIFTIISYKYITFVFLIWFSMYNVKKNITYNLLTFRKNKVMV